MQGLSVVNHAHETYAVRQNLKLDPDDLDRGQACDFAILYLSLVTRGAGGADSLSKVSGLACRILPSWVSSSIANFLFNLLPILLWIGNRKNRRPDPDRVRSEIESQNRRPDPDRVRSERGNRKIAGLTPSQKSISVRQKSLSDDSKDPTKGQPTRASSTSQSASSMIVLLSATPPTSLPLH
jgi:hypothetical protein